MTPGSPEALANGCTCAVMDNAHGQGMPEGRTFWINSDCPLHGIDESGLRNLKHLLDKNYPESDNIKDIFSKT